MDWKQLLASITGSVDEELLPRNEYLVTENRILRQQIKGRVQLTDAERRSLAEIGIQLGKKALGEVASLVKPDTILGWHRKLVAQRFEGSKHREALGLPRADKELQALVVRMAQENRMWGYDRFAGALAHLGYTIGDQTVGNLLKRHGIRPAPERKKTTTWKALIRMHKERPHQGKGDIVLFPSVSQNTERAGPIQCRKRLGGLLKYYEWKAARVF